MNDVLVYYINIRYLDIIIILIYIVHFEQKTHTRLYDVLTTADTQSGTYPTLSLELIQSWEDRNFVESDKCQTCWDVFLEMFPNLSWEALLKLYHDSVKSKNEEAKKIVQEIHEALSRKAKMIEEGNNTDLIPSSDIFLSNSYGYQVFQDIGLCTKDDIFRWTNQTPKALKMEAFKMKLDGPVKNSTELYPVSLLGLPPDELAAIRKCRMFYTNSSNRSEYHLLHDFQLAKSQSNNVFDFLTDTAMSRRPAKLSSSPLTKQQIEEKASKLESKAEEELQEQAASSDASDSEATLLRVKKRELDMGSLADPEGKGGKRPKAKAKKAAAAKGKQSGKRAPLEDDGDEEQEKADADSLAPSSARHEEELAKLDEDMRIVARNHLPSSRNNSAKCLVNMTVEHFLKETKLGQTMHGAGSFRPKLVV